jgi:hypothetical protein
VKFDARLRPEEQSGHDRYEEREEDHADSVRGEQ